MGVNFGSGTTAIFLDRPGGRVAYDVAGGGPLVVCIPGMGSMRSVYRHLASDLIEAGYRVACMDLRGHGDSDATFDSYNDGATADDTSALIEHLGGSAVIVGNSMGAAAAVLSAAAQPAGVRGLVLIGPFVRDIPTSLATRVLLRALMAGPWAARAWLSYLPKLFPARRGEEFQRIKDETADSLRRPRHRAAFVRTTRTSHEMAEAALPDVRVPTLVVMGSKDPDYPDPAVEAQWVADQLGGEIEMIADAGHYPQAEFPELVGPAVMDFLRRSAV